eukprot:955964-Alexandrium_andersonii.AAC.1
MFIHARVHALCQRAAALFLTCANVHSCVQPLASILLNPVTCIFLLACVPVRLRAEELAPLELVCRATFGSPLEDALNLRLSIVASPPNMSFPGLARWEVRRGQMQE